MSIFLWTSGSLSSAAIAVSQAVHWVWVKSSYLTRSLSGPMKIASWGHLTYINLWSDPPTLSCVKASRFSQEEFSFSCWTSAICCCYSETRSFYVLTFSTALWLRWDVGCTQWWVWVIRDCVGNLSCVSVSTEDRKPGRWVPLLLNSTLKKSPPYLRSRNVESYFIEFENFRNVTIITN